MKTKRKPAPKAPAVEPQPQPKPQNKQCYAGISLQGPIGSGVMYEFNALVDEFRVSVGAKGEITITIIQ